MIKKLATLTKGKDERFRTLYHGETKMIKPKPRQSYIRNDRKGAKKPNPAIKEIHDHTIANILFACKLIKLAIMDNVPYSIPPKTEETHHNLETCSNN